MDYQNVRNMIKAGEGSIPYMYLDTLGNVTVAVGQLLRSEQDAASLPFVFRDTQTLASPAEIAEDFRYVSEQKPGFVASHYRQYTKLELPEKNIDELLDLRISEFTSGLETTFADFNTYPDTAKEALLDMSFNLGIHGLVKKFPTLTKAVKSQDWTRCAQECRRLKISDERNLKTKELFENAALV